MSIIINNPTTTNMTNTDSGIRDNYFKNPAFSVIQGTASGTLTNSLALPTASLGYPGETEWCIAASGGTPAYAFSSTNQTLTLTGASGVSAIYVLQRIESIDANRLASKQVTLSVEISNSLLTSVIWELFRPTTTADTHGTITTPTQTVVASGTWTVTSTLTKYTATVTLPAEVSNGLEVRFRVGAQTSGTWVIARPKLEEGSSATAFVCGDYTEELIRCRRYFQWASYNMQFLAVIANETYETYHPFAVQMFAVPVISALAADPNTTQSASNNLLFFFRSATREGVNQYFVSNTNAACSVLGYRSSMSSHIP